MLRAEGYGAVGIDPLAHRATSGSGSSAPNFLRKSTRSSPLPPSPIQLM
jgi:hypothetical protein